MRSWGAAVGNVRALERNWREGRREGRKERGRVGN